VEDPHGKSANFITALQHVTIDHVGEYVYAKQPKKRTYGEILGLASATEVSARFPHGQMLSAIDPLSCSPGVINSLLTH
jgi:hypothetical protein